jgi:hypothetical protein
VSRHNLGELRIDFNKFIVGLCIAVLFIEKDLSNNNFSKSTIDCTLNNANSNNLTYRHLVSVYGVFTGIFSSFLPGAIKIK